MNAPSDGCERRHVARHPETQRLGQRVKPGSLRRIAGVPDRSVIRIDETATRQPSSSVKRNRGK